MGANLRKLLETKVEPRRILVPYEGEEYVLFGMPDATFLELQMMEENKKASRAQLYTIHLNQRGTPGEFKADDIFAILLVAHYIEQDPADPITDVEIAILSKERGLLFAQLFAGALQIVGNGDVARPTDPTLAVGLGNSDAAAPAT